MAYQEPNKEGFYGKFGGRFVPETLMTAVWKKLIVKVRRIQVSKRN